MLRGTIFGIMLTIGGAYLLDSMSSPDVGQIVNWNVAAARASQIGAFAKDQVSRLIDRAHAAGPAPVETRGNY